MSSFVPLNPRPYLVNLINQPTIVRLKFRDTEYHGTLVSIDSYMNLQLRDATEYVGGKRTEGGDGQLGMVLIRCNNVLWIGADRGTDGE